ncbi:Crp/Fnr family transcriptional regulator [Sabulicella glaciei]|uniref:Crp/Fnr family transcriptional regulator n=1 Tax=Sabulicella glaciei TaxID=2984948 RepID=A0ABT3NR90_9PROT|nr:Crp/Fnr family transcriptional regulator [Roseococcus sp. MDT2-1-1]MCW8084666.1 Crp/Fnr family transcriptional regulator [Roseococcus sp. MDT2-1-1]
MEEQFSNNLLLTLRPQDRKLLEPSLETVVLSTGTLLFEAGDDVEFVHFPCGPTLASFSVTLENGAPVETALIGREGAMGGIVSQGRLPAYARAVVRMGGPFLRIPCMRLEAAKERSAPLRNVFARYADCLLAQVFQSVACNAVHGIEARTAKWLLAALDRTGSPEVELTQEQLAGMLGVGRTYVSRVLRDLRGAGVVATRRGRLVIQDPKALHATSCHCNEALKRHFQEVLSGVYPSAEESQAMRRA